MLKETLFVGVVRGIELRAMFIVGKHYTTELHRQYNLLLKGKMSKGKDC